MLAVYASSARLDSGRLAPKLAAVWLTVVLGSLALAAVYIISPSLPINVYGLILSLIASALIAWGVLTLWTLDPAVFTFSSVARFTPLLGIQCSMPFLAASIATAAGSAISSLIGSIAFATGYSLPYLLAGAVGGAAGRIERIMNSKLAVIAQGAVIAAAGAYVLYTLYPSFRLIN